MRILILSTDYDEFLRSFYGAHPGLENASYDVQAEARAKSLFGFCDFYSFNFRAHGAAAEESRVNNAWAQAAWAREHGHGDAPPPRATLKPQPSRLKRALRPLKPLLAPLRRKFGRPGLTVADENILAAQVADFKPDVIINQEPHYISGAVMQRLRASGRLIAGQIASALPAGENFRSYDLMLSSLPNFVTQFRARGVKAELSRLAFEPRILPMLGEEPARDIALSFVGNLSPDHAGRVAFLEHVARHAPLKVWGVGISRLPASSPLHACYQGEAWGRGMYEVLRRSKITLNYHIDLSAGWANNMRLFEATGMGALLLTDAKKNLAEMFRPGEEVETYASPEDCVARIKALLADEDRRAAIAAAGQRRAISEHSYFKRTGELLELLNAARG